MTERAWTPLYVYKERFGYDIAPKYKVPANRPHDRSCMWCHGDLPTKRHKSFCGEDCSWAWNHLYTWERKRAPLPWRILCRDKFICQDCGLMPYKTNEYGINHPIPEGLDVHHILPVVDGGSDHEDNLVTLCKDCHQERHKALREGLSGGFYEGDEIRRSKNRCEECEQQEGEMSDEKII